MAAALARQGLGFALVDELTAAVVGHDMTIRALSPRVAVDLVALQLTSVTRFFAHDAFLASLKAGCDRR